MRAKHGPDDDCPECYDCPGCGGGDGSEPRRPYLDRSRPGVVVLMCSECRGAAILCPNYDREAAS